MKNGVAIKYGDVALGAKENFTPSIDGIEPFSDISILNKNNISFKNFGNPIERYSVVLDGSALPFPSNIGGENFGIWSDQLSQEDGTFQDEIILNLKATELFTSSGITISFDEQENIYPIDVRISWFRGEEKIAEENFEPNSSNYFFNKKVEYYDGLKIEFFRLNMPKNRLKIHSVEYGVGVIFYGDELKGVNVSQTLDPISAKIEINTCGFTLNSKRNVEYSFQSQQPISIYFNNKLISTSFVKTAKRTSKKSWNIQTEDYIGLMETISFHGGIYVDANAEDVIADIFSAAKIPYHLDEKFLGIKVNGYIPYTTCRNALMQVCFAIGAVVDTSADDKVNVFCLSKDVSQELEKRRVLRGQTSGEKSVVTSVQIVAHFYKESQETKDVYDSSKSGVGEGIFVKFSEPLHDLSIVNGEIISSGSNFAVINANENCVLSGKIYEHTTLTKEKKNPLVSKTDIDNVVSISNATLVSQNNVDNLLDLCYDYIVNSTEIRSKIVDGKHTKVKPIPKYGEGIIYGSGEKYGNENAVTVESDKPTMLGDLIVVPLEFSTPKIARITRQSFSLVGGIIVKDTELR